MKWISTIFFLLISFNLLAVTPIKKDEKAPHDGYIVTKEEEKSLRKITEEKIKLEDLNILKDQKIEIQEERIKVYKDYYEETKKLSPMGTWEKVGWFFLGVGVTGVGFYTTSKILKNAK